MLIEFSFDFSITENVCRCLKYSIRALSKSFSPYLKTVLQRLIQEFEGQHNPSYVFVLECCFEEFGDEEQCVGILQEAFNYLVTKLDQVLDEHSLVEDPQLANDYFSLCRSVLNFNQTVFFACPLEKLIQTTLRAIGVQTDRTADTHCRFFENLLRSAQEHQGEDIVKHLM
jgi:hypothetical protein